jgi:hypothetical protein
VEGSLRRSEQVAAFVGEDRRYQLLELINQDALGTLWRARDLQLNAPVTIRIISEPLVRSHAQVDEFRRQMNEVYPRLDHPNIAWVYYFSQGEGPVQFVVMEEVPGQTLAQWLHRPLLDSVKTLGIVAQIADGLQAAHHLGLSHGALTEDSVMLGPDGSVKLIDFGVGRLVPLAAQPGNRPQPGPRASDGPAEDVYRLGTILRGMWGGPMPSFTKLMDATERELLRRLHASLDPDPAARPPAKMLASALRRVMQQPRSPGVGLFGPVAPTREQAVAPEPAGQTQEEARRSGESSTMEDAALAQQAEEARNDEAAGRAEERARAERARQAEEALRPEARRGEEAVRTPSGRRVRRAAKRAQAARQAEEVARAEATRLAGECRQATKGAREAEARRAEVARQAEVAAGRAEEVKKGEMETLAEAARLSKEASRLHEAAQREKARLAQVGRRAEEAALRADRARKAEAAAREELARRAEEARKAEAQARRSGQPWEPDEPGPVETALAGEESTGGDPVRRSMPATRPVPLEVGATGFGPRPNRWARRGGAAPRSRLNWLLMIAVFVIAAVATFVLSRVNLPDRQPRGPAEETETSVPPGWGWTD